MKTITYNKTDQTAETIWTHDELELARRNAILATVAIWDDSETRMAVKLDDLKKIIDKMYPEQYFSKTQEF